MQGCGLLDMTDNRARCALVWRLLVTFITAILLPFWSPASIAGETGAGRLHTVAAAGQGPLNLYVEQKGHGEPVLLIHGLGGNTYTWRKIVPSIARTNRVYNLDLKGFGRSDKPDDERYAFTDQAALVKDFLLRRGLSGVTVIGHSHGGGVALALTLDANRTHPGLVRSLVLIASPAYPQTLSESLTTLRDPILGPLALTLVPPDAIASAALSGGGGFNAVTFADIQAYARPLHELAARRALIQTALQIIPPNPEQLIRAYPTIQQPALLVWCRRDDVVPLSTGQRLAQALPHATLRVFQGCLHLPMEEQSRLLSATISKFLAHH